jgi:SAM-dependent methyltransferase
MDGHHSPGGEYRTPPTGRLTVTLKCASGLPEGHATSFEHAHSHSRQCGFASALRHHLMRPCESGSMEFDPQAFQGTAAYYSIGRPPYSQQLADTLTHELSLDGCGQLLDVGCGPGVLELELAKLFGQAVALDPVIGMLREGRRRCQHAGVDNVRWVLGRAEEVPELDVGPCRVVTFGQSFHRVRRLEVSEIVYDLLEPGGSLVLISNEVDGRPRPHDPGYPSIPHASARDLIVAYLGESTRDYLATWNEGQPARFEDTLLQTRFGGSRTIYAPGRADLVRDIDTVVANYFSMSYAAPRLFGARRPEFETDLRRLLLEHSPSGLFWDWPGDTELVIATRPA